MHVLETELCRGNTLDAGEFQACGKDRDVRWEVEPVDRRLWGDVVLTKGEVCIFYAKMSLRYVAPCIVILADDFLSMLAVRFGYSCAFNARDIPSFFG